MPVGNQFDVPPKTISFQEVLQVGHSHKKPCAAYNQSAKKKIAQHEIFFSSNSFEASRILCESESQFITKLVT